MSLSLGEKIKKHRKNKGLTLEGLAKEINAGKSYVWELENRNIHPSGERLTKIAQVLGVTSEYLLDEKRSDPSPSDREEAFFRKYQQMDDPTKEKLNAILDALWDKDEN